MNKLKILSDLCDPKGSFSIEVNPNRGSYETAGEYISHFDVETVDGIEPEVMKKMIETDTVISLQVYPDHPVSFFIIYDCDIENALDLAIEGIKKERGINEKVEQPMTKQIDVDSYATEEGEKLPIPFEFKFMHLYNVMSRDQKNTMLCIAQNADQAIALTNEHFGDTSSEEPNICIVVNKTLQTAMVYAPNAKMLLETYSCERDILYSEIAHPHYPRTREQSCHNPNEVQ